VLSVTGIFRGEVELPVRIYALAKQLRIDKQALFDACKQAGITVKGSALASLSDDEVAQVKAFLSGGGRTAAQGTATTVAVKPSVAAAPAGPLRREDYIAPGGGDAPKRVPVLQPKAEPPAAPELAEPPEPPEPEEPKEQEAPPKPAEEEILVSSEKEKPESQEGPKRDAPAQDGPDRGTPVKDVAERKEALKKVGPEKVAPKKKVTRPEKSGPAIKLAPMPKAQKAPPKKKTDEPAPQKPDIKLPADAIRASKAGSKPLSEHLRKQEERRKTGAKKRPPRAPAGAEGKAKEEAPPAASKERGRRGGRAGAKAAEEGGATLGGREQRQLKRKRSAARRRRSDEDGDRAVPQRRRLRRTGNVSTAAPRKSNVVVELPCTVRSFSEALGLQVQMVLGKLLELGIMSNITASLDRDSADLLAEELGVEVEFREQVDLEDKLISVVEEADDPELLRPRPPVVTFLGHVDHGKTSLLDRMIGIDVVSSEKGGITQHIRAYRVEKDNGAVAFVDTPGHEAFTAMRARGANCTDIAVLVVAADDGVMPQTQEAISHARAAEVPIVVALNKIDLPGGDQTRALQELAANELLPSEWGGDTEVVRTSAVTGEGVDELLETLLTVAELHEYRANPDRPGSGICLEAEVQPGRGVVAKMLVDRGTLRVGDVVVCGSAYGRVKAMYDTLNPRQKHKEAGPSTPVNLTGFDVAPGAGDRFHVLEKISEARQIAEERAARTRQEELAGAPDHVTLENLFDRLGEEGQPRILNVILRADVRGSIEAILKELTKLDHPEVQIRVLQRTVGGITEADVELAHASDAVIIGFNVVADEGARSLADGYGVQIRRYDIIYQVTEDLKAALEGMLAPEKREVDLGRALVQRTFHISRVGTVAGCRVLAGTIERDARIRVIRESRVLGDYALESLRREKDDTREVRDGLECGMKLGGFNDLKEGDILEAYRIDEVRRTF